MNSNDDNPFGDPIANDPFSDPSISKIINKPKDILVDNIDEIIINETNSSPAVMEPVSAQVKPMSRSIKLEPPTEYTQHIQQRQEQLDRQINDINRYDEERGESYNFRRNNWPPLPEFCCWQPCFYQDINVEIRPEFQLIVRHLYYLWLLHGGLLLINIIGTLLLWFATDEFLHFFLAIFNTIVLMTLSFLCWYRTAYKAFRSDSSINFMVFFLAFFFQFVICVIQAIGFDGYCGFINVIKVFSHGYNFIGVLIFFIAMGFSTLAVADIYMISKVHNIYRSTGATMTKAREEFTSEFMRNQHVQNMASSAATSVFNSQTHNSRY